MKFVSITNDIAFRRIFGNENKKSVIISFLNAVLDFKDEKAIQDVAIKNPYQLPEYSGGKTTIVDVKATDHNGNSFLVEMQIAEVKDFDKRVLYYASQSYTDQIDRGDSYTNLKPTYFIGILNFEATQNTNYLSRHKIYDIETGEQIIRNMEFTFIELPKFNKAANELTSIVEQWIYFLKNSDNLNLMPESITDKGLKDAFEQADQHNWSKDDLWEYNKVFMREQDERGRFELGMERAEKKGIEKGIEKGLEKGLEKGKILALQQTAKSMLNEKISIDIITKITGLTEAEIQKL